ncbi:hypothetical protein KY285_011797 [Solanum tuberosum]|nr:hypothetical protein KY285_011797 [Solanum tuberosum]
MGGIAIFALALVPPFFLSDTVIAAIKDPLTRWDEVPQESEGNRRQGKLRTHCFLAALLLEFSKLLLALRPRITALTPRKPNGFENRPWSLPSY